MAVGREGLASAALGLAWLKLWGALSSCSAAVVRCFTTSLPAD